MEHCCACANAAPEAVGSTARNGNSLANPGGGAYVRPIACGSPLPAPSCASRRSRRSAFAARGGKALARGSRLSVCSSFMRRPPAREGGLRPKRGPSFRRAPSLRARPMRDDGVAADALERRRGMAAPSFRVAMVGPSEKLRFAAPQTARSALPLRRVRARRGRCWATAPDRQSPVFLSPSAGAPRRACGRPPGASPAALTRLKRVRHVQQDDHRLVPPGGNPGGGFER
jgi:hypothetical protein